ncbi:hypothetical protein SSX86_020070 [Deinandra increscens subsp. villosa]|uniref:Uncharacterized protein n=1 Tax=Deinandra increscens subsp. villosa TaxID=3103831 RepID=A0AAP0GXU9_9ASTR
MSGPQCCENPPAISSGDGSGEVLQIASLNSYVSGKPDLKTVLQFPNLRYLTSSTFSADYGDNVSTTFRTYKLLSPPRESDSVSYLQPHFFYFQHRLRKPRLNHRRNPKAITAA